MGTFTITGADNLETILKKLPDAIGKKAVNTILSKAARPFSNRLKNYLPGRLKKATAVKIINKAGEPLVIAGIIDYYKKLGHTTRAGVALPAYLVVYWQNYGTGLGRDPSHKFKTPLRAKKKKNFAGYGKKIGWGEIYKNRRINSGIKHRNFIETAWNETKQTVEDVVTNDSKEIITKFLKRYAV